MSPEQIFTAANMAALVCWLLLALFPQRRAADAVVRTIAPLTLAAVYTVIVGATLWSSDGSFSSLSGVAALFDNPWLLLAGWIHYLVFDLLIGRWEVRDAHERGVRYVFVVPCLALTFLFGPAGWLLYRGVRAVAASHPAGLSGGAAAAGHPRSLA
jgi:hypothetical protein